MALWNATTEEELEKPTKRFDNCGFLVPDDFQPSQTTNPYIQDDWFLPSDIEGGLEGFIKEIKIPYYDDISHIEIVDGDSDECFSSSNYNSVRLYIVTLLLFLLI